MTNAKSGKPRNPSARRNAQRSLKAASAKRARLAAKLRAIDERLRSVEDLIGISDSDTE